MNSEEIKADYTSSLSDLTFNSKPLINVLTMLAEENVSHAPDIVTAIEEHLSKVQTDVKLPILYLVDCIIKNIGGTYTELFSQNLVKTFCTVFKVVDEKTRAEMFKLRQTWNDIFPQQKLYAIDVQINMLDPAWPVTAKPPSNRIHLNPKFLNNTSRTSKKNDKSDNTAVVAPEIVAPTLDPDTFSMQQKLIQKQKELIELQQKKLELELLQTKVKLQNQLKNNSQGGGNLTSQNVLLKPEVAKQLIPGTVREEGKLKAPPMGKNQRLPSSSAKIAPVNRALLVAGSKPNRDPRLLRQQGEKINNGSGSSPVAGSKSGEINSKTITNNKLAMKTNHSKDGIKSKSSPVKSRQNVSKSRTKSPYDSRSTSSKSSSCSDSPMKPKSPSRHKKKDYSDKKSSKRDHKVDTSLTTFKGVKGVTKNRNYMRRNRSSSFSPENQDVDFRKVGGDNTKQGEVMDVDLRQLAPPPPPPPAVVGKKRPSVEGLEVSASKKSKTEVFDVLFGNEDTDLRKLPPVVVADRPPTPPPPPIISIDDKECASNFEASRAKLAYATGRDKIMAKSFRKKRPPLGDDDLRIVPPQQSLSDNMKKIIISTDDEECIKAGTMTKEQEKQLMNKIIAQIERQKLKEAQRKDSESTTSQLQAVSDGELDEEDGKFGDKDDRLAFPSKYGPSRRGGPYWRGAKRRHWDPPPPPSVTSQTSHGRGGQRAWMRPTSSINQWRQQGPNYSRSTITLNDDGNKSPDMSSSSTFVDLVVDSANQDDIKTIIIDGVPRDIRYYDETAVVFMSWDDPREISFQNGTRRVSFDEKEIYLLSFNEGYKEISVKGAAHEVRLGSPSRELLIDGRPYECYFGGAGITVELDGRMVGVRLDGPPPQVKIGNVKRNDLVAGKVNLIIDAKVLVPVFLDGKCQKFAIDGETYTLKFVDALKTVLINDVAFDVEFGGLPKPITVHDKKHFIRFPVLPRGVKPGFVDIKDMEGVRPIIDGNSQDVKFDINEPALPVFNRKKKVEEDAERNSNSPHTFQSFMQHNNFDMLSSVMTSLAPLPPSGGGGYEVENHSQEISPPMKPSVASLPPALNINDLFQQLVATGIVSTKDTSQSVDVKSVRRNALQHLKTITFNKPATLKIRQGGLYDALYAGMQCSSCGMRFPPDQSHHYSQHLDWHFRQNRKGKKNIRVAASRRWYYSLSDWKNFEEIEDLEEREKNYFDQQQSQADGANDDADEEAEIPTVPADPDIQDARCEVCQDKFDHFFNEEKEEWHLRNAIRVEDRTYHPLCFEDHTKAMLDEDAKEEVKNEEVLETKPESRGIPGLEIVLDDDDNDDDDDDDADVSGGDEVVNDDSQDKKSEVVIEESEESKLSTVENQEQDNGDDDDDVILNEIALEKIEVDDDDDYKDYNQSREPVPVKIEQVDDGFMDVEEGLLNIRNGDGIKIKAEPMDPDEQEMMNDLPEVEAKSTVDTTRTGLISSMDGNTELTSSGIVVNSGNVTGRIRINISKPMASAVILNRETHCDNNSISVPEPMIDPSQPPPPGEEPPVQLHVKPALRGLDLKKVPTVHKGSELTGMCSIM